MKDVLSRLKEEANKNETHREVFKMWSERERAREQVTLAALSQRMESRGHHFSRDSYRQVIKLMSSLGLGKLVTDSRGRPKAVTGLKYTLQSIGRAATSSSTVLEKRIVRNKYAPIRKEEENTSQYGAGATAGPNVTITFLIKGKPVQLGVPSDLNESEIADLVGRLRGGKHA